MLRKAVNNWKSNINESYQDEEQKRNFLEPIARFLKTYALFMEDYTANKDKFFDSIEEGRIISASKDELLLMHYGSCMNQAGGKTRMDQMIKLIDYLENR